MTERREVTGIVVADGQPITRFGIARLLNSQQEKYRVVAETSDAREIVSICSRARTAILVLGLPFPELSGLKIIEEVKKIAPSMRVAVLGTKADQKLTSLLMRSGIEALLSKDAPVNEIVAAIDAVAEGRSYFSTHAVAAVTHPDKTLPGFRDTRRPYKTLTEREREVFLLIAQTMSTKEISDRLKISMRTVENHRRRIMRKLGVKRSSELVRYAAALAMVA